MRTTAALWELTGRRSFTAFHFTSLILSPRTAKILVIVEIVPTAIFGGVPTTRSRCQGRGARRVTACHSQCLRTGPRPAYLSVHPHSPPTKAAGMTRAARIRSFRVVHTPPHTHQPHFPSVSHSSLHQTSSSGTPPPPFFFGTGSYFRSKSNIRTALLFTVSNSVNVS